MKKIYTILLLFTVVTIYAQDYPHLQPDLLLNKEVKIKPLPGYNLKEGEGYKKFSSDEKGYDTYAEFKSDHSKPEALVGRTFKITNIRPFELYGKHYMLTLKDEKETIYFRYTPDREYYFEVIGGLTLPENFYCDFVQQEFKDKEMAKYSPVKNYYGVQMEKNIDYRTNVTEYKLYLFASSVSEINKGYGATIFLEEGQKIDWPKALVTRDHRSQYFTVKVLSKSEIELLKKYKIVGYKMLTQEEKVDNEKGMLLKGIMNCLLTKD